MLQNVLHAVIQQNIFCSLALLLLMVLVSQVQDVLLMDLLVKFIYN